MPYEPALDGLRALAILAVIGLHTTGLPGGWAGVDIFFVLSGFLITTITEAKLAAGSFRPSAFYFGRALRLYPALLLMAATITLNSLFRSEGAHVRELAIVALTYTMNWRRMWDTGSLVPFDHTWSLALEAQFYLLWPLVLMVVPPRRKILVTSLLLALVAAWRWYLVADGAPDHRIYNGFDTHCDSLLAGSILALTSKTHGAPKLLGWRGSLPLMALAGVFAFARGSAPLGAWWALPLSTVVASFVLIAARSGGAVTRLLCIRPLVALGKISYGVYLWQGAVLYWFHLVPPYGYSDVAAFACSVTIFSIGFASLSYFLIERPVLRWRNRVLRSTPPEAASAAPVTPALVA